MSDSKRPLAAYLGLAALLAVAALFQGAYSWHAVWRLMHASEVARPFAMEAAGAQIVWASAEASAAGMRRGDRLVAVNGRPYTARADLTEALQDARPGELLECKVRGEGEAGLRTVSVRLAPFQPRIPRVGEWLLTVVLRVVMPVFCLALGFWVAGARPRDPLAWLLLALMMSFSQFVSVGRPRWEGGLAGVAVGYHSLLSSAWPIWMILFGLYFPEPLPVERRWPGLKWILLAPLGLLSLADVSLALGYVNDWAVVPRLSGQALRQFRMVSTAVAILAAVVFFSGLIARLRWIPESSPDMWRRLRLLTAGTGLGLAPWCLLGLAGLGRWDPRGGISPWLVVPSLLMLSLFPLTLAYVIVVQRAMDVQMVIRQGVRYTLARLGVRLVQLLASGAVLYAILELMDASHGSVSRSIGLIGAGVGLFLYVRRSGEKMAGWVDRRFFREAYNAEHILSVLSEKVRTIVETGPLLEEVTRRISESLHVPRVAVLLGENGAYRPAHALGYDELADLWFPADAATVRHLEHGKEPSRVYFDDADSWIYRSPDMGDGERKVLAALETQLLLPLAVKEKLLGFVSLGPKQSEEPYSGSDLRLLQSVVTQTALALENAQLTAVIAAETAHREGLRRELEIAREVQERLFPQSLPAVPGLDYYGTCRPAQGVGGDYYDFLSLAGGKLGLAVGDVSGKGIAAALLMASLQASLRSHAGRGSGDLAALMSEIHTLVYEASSSNRYASLFYAEYEPGPRGLSYVNAGHNYPVVLRAQGDGFAVVQLEAGGPVVGLLKNPSYQQATVTLEPGDVVVAYTDGISEAMNASEEEWGEERLIAAAKSCAGRTAEEIAHYILGAADQFVAGASQYDDMTLVVLKVLNP